jgi:tyrosine-protein phosphatase YwqE
MIFPFFKREREEKKKPVSRLRVDIHSHLIPALDDGAKTMAESLEMLQKLEALGYEKVITTPHIMSDSYRNTAETIGEGLKALRLAAKEAGIILQIEAGAEYYLDEKFTKKLHSPGVMSVAGKYILFESSYMSKPLQMEEMIFAIGEAGYLPMLAHPERYRYIRDPGKEYGRWKELGVLFQVNLNSFGGYYGKSAQILAHHLNEAGMIDFLGSDAHGMRHLDMLGKIIDSDIYASIFLQNSIKNDTLLG